MSEVYDLYVDTAGNYHYSDTETGHHVIPNTAVGSSQLPHLIKTNVDRIRNMTEIKLKIDDYGYVYAEMPDGTIRELLADVFGNPYFGKIKLAKEVET